MRFGRRATAEATKWEVAADASATSFAGAELAGMQTQHPFLDRKSRVIVADFVTLESGTPVIAASAPVIAV